MATKTGANASKLLVEMEDKASFDVSYGNKRYGLIASVETEASSPSTKPIARLMLSNCLP